MSAKPKAWGRRLVPFDVLVARARVGGFADLAAKVDALMAAAARDGLAVDMVEDAIADALESLLDEARR